MFYSNKMYDIANKLKSPVDRLEALQNMIVLENEDQSKKHFTEYYKLSDSIQESNNTYKISLLPYDLKVIKPHSEAKSGKGPDA